MEEAYYNRTISSDVVKLISKGGVYNWMLEYVYQHPGLDFQTGSNNNKSWFSIYRGTGRIITILKDGKIDASDAYKQINPNFYSNPTKEGFDELLNDLKSVETLKRYYSNNTQAKRYEGYYQNLISRRYSLFCKEEDEFIIIDKEFVLGYKNSETRELWKKTVIDRYTKIKADLQAIDGFPKDIHLPGTECDFLCLTKTGDIILMELKRYEDTQKIYLSPMQIGMYDDLTTQYINKYPNKFEEAIISMVRQKIELGLISPKWNAIPSKLSNIIKLAVVVGGKPSQTARENYKIVYQKVGKNIGFFTCGDDGTLIK